MVDILDIIGSGLEVARCIVALRNEHVVVLTALNRFVKRDRCEIELLLDVLGGTKAVFADLQFGLRVGIVFGDGGDDSDVIILRTDIMGRADNGNINI